MPMKLIASLLITSFCCWVTLANANKACGQTGIALTVLGSGGPELNDQRASSGYLIWQDGQAKFLIDLGPGSLNQFETSGAKLEDLDAILLTHLHVDHSADLPRLVKGSFFTARNRDLPVYGPSGNHLMPDTESFVQKLFAKADGAYRYLGDFLTGERAYRLTATSLDAKQKQVRNIFTTNNTSIATIAVHHGPIPALAWRIDIGGKRIVISGDMNGDYQTLPILAKNADLLIAHHAIPEGTTGIGRKLHMPPSVIGNIAAQANVKNLVLSHRMLRSLGKEQQSSAEIRKHYAGPMHFADDGQCFALN